MTEVGRRGVRVGRLAVRLTVDLGLPTVLYYLLRAVGISVYAALLAGAVLSAVTAAVPLLRHGRVDGVALYMTVMMLGSVAVSLAAGSTRFLLARGALLTAVTGTWFLAGLWGRRPLVYLFCRPLLEGRFRWPGRWDLLWERSPAFRRMWRVSSVLHATGCLVDAAARVWLAYTVPADLVPLLSTILYSVTSVVLIVVTNVYYLLAGIHDHGSSIYRTAGAAPVEAD